MFLPFDDSDGLIFQLCRLSTPSVTIHYLGIYGIWAHAIPAKDFITVFVKKHGVWINFEMPAKKIIITIAVSSVWFIILRHATLFASIALVVRRFIQHLESSKSKIDEW